MNSSSSLDLDAIPRARMPIRCHGSRGTPYTRWIPYGMPQLGRYKEILDSVFFLYPSEEDADRRTKFGGTGFLVAVPCRRWPDHDHIHGITNWHVACELGCSTVRINRIDGAPEVFPLDPVEWVFRPRSHDIAISPPLMLDVRVHKVRTVPVDALLTSEMEVQHDINAGDDVFMAGRFVDYHGSETNVPAYRFGNISIIDAKVKQRNGYFGRSIVIDMHSRSGFSGSPVFVYRTTGSLFLESGQNAHGHLLKLLGIHWGQFPEKWELKSEAGTRSIPEEAALITDGKYVEGLSGMTCVAPASAILDLLDDSALQAMREANERKLEPLMAQRGLEPKAE